MPLRSKKETNVAHGRKGYTVSTDNSDSPEVALKQPSFETQIRHLQELVEFSEELSKNSNNLIDIIFGNQKDVAEVADASERRRDGYLHERQATIIRIRENLGIVNKNIIRLTESFGYKND